MREQAVAFGRAQNMVGVLTQPDAASKAPHVLILNAGFVHHVGPGRLTVEIARRLVEAGFPSLRFDFSGIGDSAPRVPPLDPISCGIADAREAMDHLAEAQGAREFVLVGLCSGARHAHHIAAADSRVVGAVMLDGYAFPTTRSSVMALGDRLDDPLALLAGAKRRAMRLLRDQPTPAVDEEGEAFFPGDPTRAQMARELHALAARDVGLLYIYSGEWRTYRYEGQLRDAFRDPTLKPILTERLIADADHLYFTRPERTTMLAMLTSWLGDRFSSPT